MARIHPALSASARVTWKVVSFPLIAGLLSMQPVVGANCGFVLVFGLVAANAFELATVGPQFPFQQVAGMALGFGLCAALHHLALMPAPGRYRFEDATFDSTGCHESPGDDVLPESVLLVRGRHAEGGHSRE